MPGGQTARLALVAVGGRQGGGRRGSCGGATAPCVAPTHHSRQLQAPHAHVALVRGLGNARGAACSPRPLKRMPGQRQRRARNRLGLHHARHPAMPHQVTTLGQACSTARRAGQRGRPANHAHAAPEQSAHVCQRRPPPHCFSAPHALNRALPRSHTPRSQCPAAQLSRPASRMAAPVVVRLRGLPTKATAQEVLAFLNLGEGVSSASSVTLRHIERRSSSEVRAAGPRPPQCGLAGMLDPLGALAAAAPGAPETQLLRFRGGAQCASPGPPAAPTPRPDTIGSPPARLGRAPGPARVGEELPPSGRCPSLRLTLADAVRPRPPAPAGLCRVPQPGGGPEGVPEGQGACGGAWGSRRPG